MLNYNNINYKLYYKINKNKNNTKIKIYKKKLENKI